MSTALAGNPRVQWNDSNLQITAGGEHETQAHDADDATDPGDQRAAVGRGGGDRLADAPVPERGLGGPGPRRGRHARQASRWGSCPMAQTYAFALGGALL